MKQAIGQIILLSGAFACTLVCAEGDGEWPASFSGQIEPVELVEAIVGTVDPHRRGLTASFDLTLIDEDVLLVDERSLEGLPLEKNRAQLAALGLSADEIDTGYTSASMNIPFPFSEKAQSDADGFGDYILSSAEQLERLRVPTEAGFAGTTCSGLLPGTIWTARASNAVCSGVVEVTYECRPGEEGTDYRWRRIELKTEPQASDLAAWCR